VDGFHRYHAALAVQGEEGSIAVTFKSYASEQELFLEAVSLNARHGIPFESIDLAHAMLKAQDIGIQVEQLAVALAVTPNTLYAIQTRRYASSADGTVILKAPVSHMAGGRLNRRQVAVNDKLVGMQASYYINRVIDLLSEKMFNLDDPNIISKLEELERVLSGALGKVRAAA
jgi:hypothetical protein